MSILALDPGLTTGFCGNFDGRIVHGQVPPQDIWRTLHSFAPKQLIVEAFIWQPRHKVDLTPVEVIGRIREWSEQANIPIIQEFTLSIVKHFFPDERLKEMDAFFPGERHANDAARHLLYYMKFGKEVKRDN